MSLSSSSTSKTRCPSLTAAAGAGWFSDLSEFVLPYDKVREAESPDAALLEFCESTYEAAAELASQRRLAAVRFGEQRPSRHRTVGMDGNHDGPPPTGQQVAQVLQHKVRQGFRGALRS